MSSVELFLPGFKGQLIECDGVEINCAVAGSGPPLLLLHGHPQTQIVWRKVAPSFVEAGYTVVTADLRGYGDSAKPSGDLEHSNYSKRVMAKDQVTLMQNLGFDRFAVIGHDRGGRVAHRMALDFPDSVSQIIVVDIAPTATMYALTNKEFASRYFWWFFLIQPADLPERMIGHDPEFFLKKHIEGQIKISGAVAEEVFKEYLRCYRDPATIHAICEDYRAAASIDLVHDEEDKDKRIKAPLLALWGEMGTVGALYDVIETWKDKAVSVQGKSLPCGHTLAEEVPEMFTHEVLDFLDANSN